LEAPASVEASSTDRYEETYPLASIVRYNFPASRDMPPVEIPHGMTAAEAAAPEELKKTVR